MGGPFDLARDRRAGGLARAAEMDGLREWEGSGLLSMRLVEKEARRAGSWGRMISHRSSRSNWDAQNAKDRTSLHAGRIRRLWEAGENAAIGLVGHAGWLPRSRAEAQPLHLKLP